MHILYVSDKMRTKRLTIIPNNIPEVDELVSVLVLLSPVVLLEELDPELVEFVELDPGLLDSESVELDSVSKESDLDRPLHFLHFVPSQEYIPNVYVITSNYDIIFTGSSSRVVPTSHVIFTY